MTFKPTKKDFYTIVLPIGSLWLILQIFMWWHNGTVTSLEAVKYLSEADAFLKTGKYSSNNYLFYSTQIMLIAFCMKMHIGYWLIVVIQILLNGLSVICFYKTIRLLTNKRWLSITGTMYFLVMYYYHIYNTFLYTESIFFSLSVIYCYVLFSTKRLNFSGISSIILLLALLYFTRPTAIFFIPATYLFIVLRHFPKKALRVIIFSSIIALIGFFFLFNYSIGSGGEFDFLLPYTNENIICGVTTTKTLNSFSIPVDKNSIQGLAYLITHYFDLFITLTVKRLEAFWGVMRTFYSLPHNIFLAFYYYLIYFAILFNIRDLFRKNRAEIWFLLADILLMMITVMLTCDEWHNRFLLSVTPFLLLLGIISINNSTNRRKKFN